MQLKQIGINLVAIMVFLTCPFVGGVGIALSAAWYFGFEPTDAISYATIIWVFVWMFYGHSKLHRSAFK